MTTISEQQYLFEDLPPIIKHSRTKKDSIPAEFDGIEYLINNQFRHLFATGKLTYSDLYYVHAEEGDLTYVPRWARDKFTFLQSSDREHKKINLYVPKLGKTFDITSNTKQHVRCCFEFIEENGCRKLFKNECDYTLQILERDNSHWLFCNRMIERVLNNVPQVLFEEGAWQEIEQDTCTIALVKPFLLYKYCAEQGVKIKFNL